LEPDAQYADIATAMLQKSKVHWQCLIGGASKWKPGQLLEKKIKHSGKEIILLQSLSANKPAFLL
jgi:S-adenosylmethionine:tRNA ribosyltransferase-isomerase